MTLSSTSSIAGYPKNLSTLNTIKKSDTFVELPIATAQTLMKGGKIPKDIRKKLKELQQEENGKIYLTFEDIIFDPDKLEDDE